MLKSKIPATIVTGFLGAGKTTLVRHLLANAQGRRIALIVNEFGDIGVDSEILAGCGAADCAEGGVIELANGCLCCTVADEFVPAMESLLNRPQPPDHIVIETSGLALPKPLVKAFDWPAIRSRVTVDGVVALVDALSLAEGRFDEPPPDAPHDDPVEEVFEDQLLCADLVVLNKTDLVADIEPLLTALRARLRPGVKVLPTRQAAIDPAVLLGLGAAVEDHLAARPGHHDDALDHDHDDWESFAVAMPALIDPAVLDARLAAAALAHDILRCKGFLAVEGKAMRHVVQAVGGRVQRHYDRPWAPGEAREGRLVVIGLRGLDRAAITALLAG
ncbi:MAG: cobalamin biosynthesis protein CobW [Alphaproteobacteria bacterium]|nr:cobalamin biosynthesis protein CobW [Alphaproteobacteria bacterium]